MLRIFQQTWFIPGALGGNFVLPYKTPCDLQLLHISLSNSAATAGTLKVGRSGDDDAYLTAKTFGTSNTPQEIGTPGAFDGVEAGGQYPHIPKGSTVLLTITNNSMANAVVVLTFSEG